MFQLNKKLLFIIFGIILIIGSLVTCYFIYQKNNEKVVVGEIKSNKKKPSSEFVLNINGKYDYNDIKINDKEKLNGEYTYSYFEIDGLKDKNLESKINTEVRKIATTGTENSKNFDSFCDVVANYSNVLSISCSFYYYDKNVDSADREETYLNYNLTNGEKLTFDELFVDNAPIDTILSKSYYNYNIIHNKKIDAESNTRLLVSEYDKDNFEFGFTSNNISYKFKDKIINFDMIDFKEYIAIYDRYKDVSDLYEEKIAYKNLHPLYDRFFSFIPYYDDEWSRYIVGYLDDYLYSEVSYSGENFYIYDEEEEVSNSDKEIYDKVYDKYLELLDEKINEFKGSSKAMYLSGNYDLLVYEELNERHGTENVNKIFNIGSYITSSTMDKKVFTDQFIPNRISYDENVYNKLEKSVKEKEYEEELYLVYKDDEVKIVKNLEDLTVGDIFKDEEYYREFARNELKFHFDNDGIEYTEDEIEEIIDKGNFSYDFNDYVIYFDYDDYSFAIS